MAPDESQAEDDVQEQSVGEQLQEESPESPSPSVPPPPACRLLLLLLAAGLMLAISVIAVSTWILLFNSLST